MRKIKHGILHIMIFFLKIIYAFIKLAPTRKKITFISRQSNRPSIDILTLQKALRERHPEYEIVLLPKKMDNKLAYIPHMFTQMRHIATSRVVLLDSYCIVISLLHHKSDLQVVQMWHAIGSMKKFGYAMVGKEEGRDPDIARILKMHRGYDKILISSMSFIKDYQEGFDMDPATVVEIPLPKADLLTDPAYKEKKRRELYLKYPQLQEKKNILYCPTFRKDESPDTVDKVNELIDLVDFEKYNFIYKPHPLSIMEIDDERVMTRFDRAFDMFFISDYVISDYSSVIYEAGLAGCPVFLYAYDCEEYRTKRELNIDLASEVPTVFSGDPKKIIKAIEDDDFDEAAFKKFIDHNVTMPAQGTCCDAIIDLLDL
ncbi:MAG: CDP-glycerol glycerophosphotransferase family protein [Anaerovoracaceae bacterium]|jgi:CDP-ribitol ribitolphosphotransferase